MKLKKYKVHGLTVKDIARQCLWKDVKKALQYHYAKTSPETYIRYQEIFEEIKEMTYPVIDPKERIECKCPSNWLDMDIEQYYGIHTNKYSMMFRPWAELANIKIENKTLDYNLRPEIVAHFLWEITYSGFHEKEIKKVSDKLNKKVEDIETGKAKTVPFESVTKKLDEKIKKANSKVGAKNKRKKIS